ncbi:MAG: polyprenyl synthetase family protein [Candidatus Aenigmarchaeota archaeon]|nr:polyprenyl synthetase family protein [Candidatus Aenigmarchaeota archaeon]
MDVMQELLDYKKKTNPKLKQFFDDKIEEIGDPNNTYSILTSFLKDYTIPGGKGIRSALVYQGFRLFADDSKFDKDYIEKVITLSTVAELKQAYYLAHDDVIDKSDERRGSPSMHKALEAWYLNQDGISAEDAIHQGKSMAILAGNMANTFAENIIFNSTLPDDKKYAVLEILNDTDDDTLHGQVNDVHSGITPEMLTEEELLKIHELKSAVYTIESPLLIGAVLAGASEEELEILSEYAIPLGQAFQVQDDILGLFGDKEIGKPADSDLKEGKKTLLMIKALENASHSQKRIINDYLGNPNVTGSMVKQVQDIVRSTGSLDYSVNLAKGLISESKEYLNQLKDVNPDAKEFLLAFADYMVDRKH